MMTTQTYAQLVAPAFAALQIREFMEFPPEYPSFCDLKTSSKSFEEEHEFAGIGQVRRKTEAGDIAIDAPIQGASKRIRPDIFGLQVKMSRELKDDDQTGFLTKLPGMLGRSMKHQMEAIAVQPLNNGWTLTPATRMIDGKPLFDTGHLLLGGGTLSNVVPSNQDLSETALNDLEILTHGRTDDRGFVQYAEIGEVLIPKEMIILARKLSENTNQIGTANNDINTVKGFNYKVVHRLTSTTAWFALAKGQEKAVKLITRIKPHTNTWDNPETMATSHSIYARFNSGCFDWRNIYGSTGLGV